MKTTLINCAVKASKKLDGTRVPLGCLYLLAAAREAGFNVRFRDYQLQKLQDPLDPISFFRFIEDDSEVLAISCMSNLLPLVLAATRIYRSKYPSRKIILGGIGPSGVAERLMAEFQHIDVVVKGEGDIVFPELLKALEKKRPLDGVEGLVMRGPDGKVHAAKPVKRIRDLDKLPLPAYDLADMRSYEGTGIQTARGCTYPCTFCDVSSYWGFNTCYRSLEPVMNELELLEKKYRFDKVNILDDTFVIDPQRALRFCDAFLKRKLKVRWSAYCRVDSLTDEVMEAFAKAGCYRLFLGIESGSNDILQRISKPIDHDMLFRIVKKAAGYFIVRTNLIWGFPFETMEDLKASVDMLLYLKVLGCDVSLSLLSPLPLSRLYNEYMHDIVLREGFQSGMVSSRFYLPDGGDIVDGKPDELVNLIRKHPDIFPGFYTFKDGLFNEKVDYLISCGLEIEKLAR